MEGAWTGTQTCEDNREFALTADVGEPEDDVYEATVERVLTIDRDDGLTVELTYHSEWTIASESPRGEQDVSVDGSTSGIDCAIVDDGVAATASCDDLGVTWDPTRVLESTSGSWDGADDIEVASSVCDYALQRGGEG